VPATALVNARVSFGATATPSGCTGSVTYEWDFGDGSAHSTDQNPVHTYTRTGTFNWTMSARISGASPCTKSGSINVVESTAPTANFTWTPTSPQVGQSVQFIDASTGAPPLTWAWDFNSDGVTDSTAQNPTHVFTNPGPFQVTLKVSNPYGEARVNKTVNVGSAAGVPVITNVRRQYPGVFLAGSNLDNTFEVTVDWKGTPGTVSFSINGGPAVVKRGTSSGASHTFRMGTDFQPSWSPSTVTIIPTNGEGKTGEPWREYVYIFPYPTWLQQAITRDPSSLTGSPDTSGWRYSVNVEFPIPHLGENEETKIPDILVPILGRRFGVKETFGYIRGEFSSNGNGMVSVYGQTGFEAMGKSIEGRVGGSGEFRLSAPKGLELTWASLNVGFNGTISEEKDILLVIPKLAWAEKIPKIGDLIREFNKRATLEFQISPSLDLTCGFAQGGSGDLEFSEGTATLGLDAKGILKVPIVEKRLSARAWVGGGGNFTLGVPRPFIRGAEFLLQPGVELTVDFWNLRFCPRAIYNYGCKWNPGSGWDCDHGGSFDEECGQTSGSGLPVNEVDPALTAQEGSSQGSLSLIETNYAQFGPYSVFHPTSLIKSASAEIPASVQETTLISNLFAGASPMILATEGGKLLLWVHQDPALPVLQSTDISWSYNDGSGWSTPTLITHDTQAELSPVAGVDTNGKVVAAWLRIKDPAFSAPINSIGDLPLFYTQLEVVSAVFDPLTRTWGPIAQLTDDTAFDTDLRLSSDGKGRLLLTWLSNPCGEFISTSACPSTLKYSFWNGSNWSTPRVVDVGLVGVSTHAAAVYGTKAFIIVPREGVLDLYTWTGSGWSRASTFAAGGVENRLPSVAYDAKGEGHIVWLRGDDLVHATLSDPRPRVARAGSRSLAFYSARLLSNPQGNLTLVWQEVSDNGPANIFAMIYDPASQSWSADRRLNQGTWMAHDVSGYYGSDGLLHLVYLATDIERTTETVQIGGKAWTITNVPREGRTDLRLLEHSLVIDLAVTDGDIRITPERPRPGDFVTATVVVHNAGDFPVGSFFVNIYAGNPDVGGTLLGSSRVTGPVRAGDRRIIRFSFVYPETGGNIIAVVDANNDVTEFTEANNRATLYLDNTAPVARVVASVTSGRAPLTVNFDASASFDREGDTMSFSWAFADGSPSASGMTVSHTFSRPGRYPVVVAVTDAKGAVGTAIVTITVDPACTYSIAPTGRDFPASGGSSSVSVKAPSGCAWQAVSNDSWITITSGSTGSGNGTVNYSVAANASTSQRTGTMTIAGQTFTVTQAGAPGGSAPTATTGSATNVTSNSATLNATVNPNGLATTVYFQWGTSPSYGNSTSSQSIGSGTNTVNVSANLSGLSPDTTYYYRIVATNSAGTTYGSGMSFRTDGSGLRAEFVKLQSGEITSISDAIALLNNPRSNPRVAFIHNGVVDFTDDEGAPYGFFPRQFRFEDIPILSGDPNNFAARFTGFIRIPAGPPPNTYTFAVGSDDGFRLTINDGTRDHVAEYAGLRAIGVGPLLQITFPPQGGLFPIELVYFESGGGAILEFSFARGAQNMFSTSTFTLVSPSMLSAANSRAHIFYYPWYGSPRTDGR
jgi:PKD repeat protein